MGSGGVKMHFASPFDASCQMESRRAYLSLSLSLAMKIEKVSPSGRKRPFIPHVPPSLADNNFLPARKLLFLFIPSLCILAVVASPLLPRPGPNFFIPFLSLRRGRRQCGGREGGREATQETFFSRMPPPLSLVRSRRGWLTD